jgi:hypothetical protein
MRGQERGPTLERMLNTETSPEVEPANSSCMSGVAASTVYSRTCEPACIWHVLSATQRERHRERREAERTHPRAGELASEGVEGEDFHGLGARYHQLVAVGVAPLDI